MKNEVEMRDDEVSVREHEERMRRGKEDKMGKGSEFKKLIIEKKMMQLLDFIPNPSSFSPPLQETEKKD